MANPPKAARVARPVIKLPMTNDTWRSAYQLACKIAVENGYHLGLMYDSQDAHTELLVKGGVLRGIAGQFVSRVREWLDSIC